MRLQRQLLAALEAHLEGGNPRVPEGASLLWNGFAALSRARGSGPAAITFPEIEAWSRLMRVPLEPHQVEILCAMDQLWLKHVMRKSEAPEGVKTLPRSSGQPMTPAMFDAVLG